MDAIYKAAELGRAIALSKEMTDYKKCEVQLEADDKAKELLSEYKKLQIELVGATRDNKPVGVIENIKGRLFSKQEEIDGYETTKRYQAAKSAFDDLMKKVNDVIIFTVTGEEACSPEKCSSCSGCK